MRRDLKYFSFLGLTSIPLALLSILGLKLPIPASAITELGSDGLSDGGTEATGSAILGVELKGDEEYPEEVAGVGPFLRALKAASLNCGSFLMVDDQRNNTAQQH